MMTWGTADGLRSVFGPDATIDVNPRTFRYHFATAERYADLMMATFPPFVAVADAMDADARSAFHADLTALAERWNDGDGHLDLPLTYVIALVRPAG